LGSAHCQSGAPGWTLELAGFDLSNDGEKLEQSGAALLDGIRGELQGERGLWPTGKSPQGPAESRISETRSGDHEVNFGYATLTKSTMFWAGETFTPSLIVSNAKGKKANIQHVLQDAFLLAFERLVEAVGDVDSVIGFEVCFHGISSY
jgi:hypothetical protein